MRRNRPAAVVVLSVVAAILAACDDGRRVEAKQVSEPRPDGRRDYWLDVSDGPLAEGGRFARTATANDDWVRHCFDRAEVGGGLPFYCSAGRTRTEVTVAFLTMPVTAAAIWLALTPLVGRRVPPRAPVDPVPSNAWLFRRAEAEKRSHRPVWREHWRMAVTGYASKMAVSGFAGALLAAFLAQAIGPAWVREWVTAAGLVHLVSFALLYGWWGIGGRHVDDVAHARLTLAIGIGVGLLLAGVILHVPVSDTG